MKKVNHLFRRGVPIWCASLSFLALCTLLANTFTATSAQAAPYPTTMQDYAAPGTQPIELTHPISDPSSCTNCHSDYNDDEVEPYRNWAGSMMAQSGRDPLFWAAIAVANQDADHSGETCLRCHLPGGWLQGRSTPEDGSQMTAADREGVQCNICHRMIDPLGAPGAPAEDAAILAALSEPVTTFANAMMVIDPEDRMRGPFDVIADNGGDPHLPNRSTLVSPFHQESQLCGTCHDLRNTIFTRDGNGDYVPNALNEAGNVEDGFPEQLTYTEWSLSAFADTGVVDGRFGGNNPLLVSCQDCHMPDVTGRDAKDAPVRDDLPLHSLLGANTFIPKVLPHHPIFGDEVDASLLERSAAASTDFLQRSADLSAHLEGGELSVRVINRTGHKLPTGYPEGRRMWLHVRAFDGDDNLVLESGRYVYATATLIGAEAEPGDVDYDPNLKIYEVRMGMTEDWAATVGKQPGKSFHLVLSNVILKDTRIPPVGYDEAAFAAVGAEPVAADFEDGEYWADAIYAVPGAERAEVTLNYQTSSREYIEFLKDENTTNAAGPILYDLWENYGKSAPVAMARTVVTDEKKIETTCAKNVDRTQAKYLKNWVKSWNACLLSESRGLSCDTTKRDAKLVAAATDITSRIGGLRDAKCAGEGLTGQSLGHQAVCPAPCSGSNSLHTVEDLGTCAQCLAESYGGIALEAAYGDAPPALPSTTLSRSAQKCQLLLAKSAEKEALGWAKEISRCEAERTPGDTTLDCQTDRAAALAKLSSKTEKRLSRCQDWTGLAGCGATGNATDAAACIATRIADGIDNYTTAAYPAGSPEGDAS